MYTIVFGKQEMHFDDFNESYVWKIATELYESAFIAKNKEELKIEVRWQNDEKEN